MGFRTKRLAGTMALVLSAGTAVAATAQFEQIGQRTGPTYPPLTVQQLVQIPALQLRPKYDSNVDVGAGRGYGTILGGWRYSLTYHYTPQGWRVTGYSVEKVAAAQDTQVVSAHTKGGRIRHRPVYQPNFMRPDPVLPPGPGSIPEPGEPDNPSEDHEVHGAACPLFNHPGFDGKWEWVWVPTHTVTNDDGTKTTIPEHWELHSYTISFAPTDFCD